MTELPRWGALLLAALAAPGEEQDVLGDLEEAHRRRVKRHRAWIAGLLTRLEIIEMCAALVRVRVERFWIEGTGTMSDYKLGLRMLLKYPGLTLAGGLALAIAIGVGAGWYDVTRDILRPPIPLPEGDRLVEIEMRNTVAAGKERRLLHDLLIFRRDAKSIVDLGAYRTTERNLVIGHAPAEPVSVAEISASAFDVARVAPVLGRPLIDADEAPGAPPVVVIGYQVWQRQFNGRTDVIGDVVTFGEARTTIVGVMPEGFAFPVNHRFWVPLHRRSRGYAALEGPAVRICGRLAPGVSQAQANAELRTIVERTAAETPKTHEHLRPRVLAYGGESPGDRTWLEFVVTHLPILLVLLVACMNVGTLVYARTATREAEIATRHALGAGRGRIVGQLFVEALVLASLAGVVGLVAADRLVRWGMHAYYAGQVGGAPFWVNPGLKPMTMIYAAGLTLAGALILGVLPGIRATSVPAQSHLRHLGLGGATLRFGKFWTTAMIGQVTLTVICLPPALGIANEAIRDRRIRERFPAAEYLSIRLELDHDASMEGVYREFERRLTSELGVLGATFANSLPGMQPDVRSAEVEAVPGAAPVAIPNLWTESVGPQFFQVFNIPIVAGRDFIESDRVEDSTAVMVNEAFARRYFGSASPIGRRVRYASADSSRGAWFEIVGMVRDIGMTPTDLGEAPYVFTPASITTTSPLVVAVHVAGDPAALAPRTRQIAAGVRTGVRVDEVRTLDEIARSVDLPMMAMAGAIVFVVVLGLFMSAAGIFSLMSVSVARRTREIGLRTALGASRGRLLAGIFSRAALLVGSGVTAGNVVLLLFVWFSNEASVRDVADALVVTSSVMLTVGLLACVEPARRAMRIEPTHALKEV